ncbi:hypothetical protein DFP72DRAFT_206144 [Ephemerocybe angulata]|uniref:HMG box domain-containing protein n=1 Tax=Ephemerocybe angulata TaxID=980116 RepID=A0A8H6MDU8_9AGAR|nr:hypothetical protein DFP72DRAFT_206144 [Tulosesus angulatus]
MAKTATVTKTKTATKAANTKTKDGEDKPKRAPTAYQIFCKAHMKKWNEDNPGRAKEAMSAVRLSFYFISVHYALPLPLPLHHSVRYARTARYV